MKNMIDDATTIYALRRMLPILTLWALGLAASLGFSLVALCLTSGLLHSCFAGLAGAAAALLYTYVHRIRRVCAELHRLE